MLEKLQDCCFSFVMSKEAMHNPFDSCIRIGDYFFSHDENTPICISSFDGRELVLFGYVIDVRNGMSNGLAEKILCETKIIDDVIDYEKWLGGKYLIIYRDASGCYVVPDATASIPIQYTTANTKFLCSSCEAYIVNAADLKVDRELQLIRNASDISQAMPYDVTSYYEIKCLLPNHILCCQSQTVKRFVNAKKNQEEISAEEAVKITAKFIENLAAFFVEKSKIYCPITGGKDSRVVMGYLDQAYRNAGKNILGYTIRHANYTGKEDDLIIPEKLARLGFFQYEQIKDEPIDAGTYERMDIMYGKNRYSKRTLLIANTVHYHYGDGAIVNGDIMGQVGKCSLHRDIPDCFASADYFRCKLHNYTRKTNEYIKAWLRDIDNAEEHVNVFDLFSIESRLGRWASQENSIYNSIGQLYVNIFNSRSIIYTWTRVARKKRKNAEIQKNLIQRVRPEMLNVPFETDQNILVRISKINGVCYYIGSRIKHVIKYMEFRTGKKE